MKEISLTKTRHGYRVIEDWYKRFESKLQFPFRTERIETSLGYSEVLITGEDVPSAEKEIPVLLIHGAMSGAPHALGELGRLSARIKLYAVNVPGQSIRAEQVRFSFRNDDYGRWLAETMDGLGLESALVCGVSWGASVALQLAKHAPTRIDGLLLVVPGSIVRGSALEAGLKVGLPMLRYRLFPTEANRDKAFAKILTSGDEYWSPYLGDVLAHWNIDYNIPPIVSVEDMARMQAPVSVIAADEDLYFPGDRVIKRCEELFSSFLGGKILVDTHHTPSFQPEARAAFTELFEKCLSEIQKAG